RPPWRGAWLQRTNLWRERTNLRTGAERLRGVANTGPAHRSTARLTSRNRGWQRRTNVWRNVTNLARAAKRPRSVKIRKPTLVRPMKPTTKIRFTEPQIALVMRAHPNCNLDRLMPHLSLRKGRGIFLTTLALGSFPC